jgi:hypothetical protein
LFESVLGTFSVDERTEDDVDVELEPELGPDEEVQVDA